ncbi:MAG: hypothetical protein ACLP2P_17350 [Desulfobaccales bacterium]
MVIVKSKGLTPTERLLADLCERSFLKLWSYPNPFKDDRDELCDLLAVFENHLFIFFDRENRQLDKSNKDPLVNWNRWKKKAIDDQIRTAHGAESYIKSGRGIFLDNHLEVPFPIEIDFDKMIIHKIIIAHGAKEACEKFSNDNVYGSLAISYGNSENKFPFPFRIDIDKERPVHVFDSFNLPVIFGELDTFFDFSSYLDAKIDAIRSLDGLFYCGEEDLLAHYYLNFDDSKKKHFIGISQENYNCLMIGEGEWKDFKELEIFKNKKLADEVSYLWDKIIQKTCQNALDGTLLGNANLLKGKSAIHEMAKEPRFFRRALSDQMIQSIRNFPESSQPIMRNLSFMPSFYPEKGYVFLQLKKDKITNYESEYRPKRQAMLEIACGAAKNKFGHLKTVIGIAIDAPKYSERESEDFILMDCSHWPDDLRENYEKANESLRFFKSDNLTIQRKNVTEFPIIEKSKSK